MDRDELQHKVSLVPFWYHKIELPGGITTPGTQPIDPAKYGIPDDLTGKSILDIGAWDGYWTFEAIKRGASRVFAIDDFSDGTDKLIDRSTEWETFDLCAEALGVQDKVERETMNVYEIPMLLPVFDIVFFFGTLYHLKFPFLALNHIRACCKEQIYVETAILNGCKSAYGDWAYDEDDCSMEFYPDDQYGLNHTNWWVPSLRCAHAMVEQAGFKNVESWKLCSQPNQLSRARGYIKGDVDDGT